MTAPVASGWSDSPGGPCTHWRVPPFHGAHPKQPFRRNARVDSARRGPRVKATPERIVAPSCVVDCHAAMAEVTIRRLAGSSFGTACLSRPGRHGISYDL